MAELILRGGTIVTPEGLSRADLAIEDGKIQAIGAELPGGAAEIDAAGLHVFPAVIDVHLHFNEPGRTEWEGAATGSRGLAAGGGAVFFDMPLNSTPCTVNAREFDRKRAALAASSVTDFGLWGGIIPGNVGEMEALADRGVVGYKAFMCDSGLPEFPRADDFTLWKGLEEAARLNLPVSVHAENHEITQALSRAMREQGRSGARDFLASRPVIAEVEAIRRATLLAEEAGAKLHIVHISSGRGVAAAAEAKARGVDVSIETCAHYLFFTEDDLERLGAIAKCAPPLRPMEHRSALWEKLLDGTVDIVASDHSPAPPGMKAGNISQAWGGIAGVQSTLAVLIDKGHFERALALERISELTAATPARRFRIAHKGKLVPGNDADITLVDLNAAHTLRDQDLHQRYPLSPYAGSTFRGAVRRTLRRGETIFRNGVITAQGCGALVRPS